MALRQNNTGGTLVNNIFGPQFKFMSLNKVIADNEAIDANYPPLLYFDPGGAARDALLPAEADAKDQVFIIKNIADAAENIVLKDDSDVTTIATLNQGDTCMVHCDGTTWRQIGGNA